MGALAGFRPVLTLLMPAKAMAAALMALALGSVPAQADLAAAEAAIAARKYDAAIAELQPMAESGDGYAKWKLAQLYLAGHGGTVTEGVELLKQAAEAGEPEAQSRLGVLYAKGEGVPQSDTEAYKWLSLAARGASPGVSRLMAETNQSIVGQRMTPEQRAEAQAKSDEAAAGYQAPVAAAATPESVPASTPAPEIEQPQAAALPPSGVPAGIRLQIASVPNESDVEGEWQRLKKRLGAPLDGQELHVERADLGAKGVFYRLQIGPFADRAAANATCRDIMAAGGECLLVGP
ncbi:SPOR domain-containing protein [Dongia sp.]|uniref:SPOR domain-containing protein n=1 Tax=Dongia sp. TaxID=1977262 RepID=UPI0035B3FBE9